MKSQCIADDCSASNPKISEIDFSSLLSEVQVKLKEKKLDKATLKKCSHCGTVWAKYFEPDSEKMVEKLGTRQLGSDKMFWSILE